MHPKTATGPPLRTADVVHGFHWHVPAGIAVVAVALSFHSYLLFHTVVELLTVTVAATGFLVCWHTWRPGGSQYLTALASGYLGVAAIDFVHALAYRGMNVLPGVTGANEATQLWIAARYLEALLLLGAPFFAERALRRELAVAISGAAALILIGLVFAGAFPNCYVEGEGLTTFKVASEYAIVALLAGAMAHLWSRRARLDAAVVRAVLLANVFTIAAELSFTQYASVFGPANLLGHVFRLFAFWQIYLVLVARAFDAAPGEAPDSPPLAPAGAAYGFLIAAAVAVPAAIFAVVAWEDYHAALAGAEREVDRTTEIFHGHAVNVLQAHDLAAERVNERIHGMTWEAIGASRELRGYLARIRDDFPQVQAIWLADGEGRVRNASEALPATTVSVASRDYFRALRERDRGLYVGERVRAQVMEGWNFNTARRRASADGGFDGVIVVTVFTRFFHDFWTEGASHADASVSLVRDDGAYLARLPAPDTKSLRLPMSAPVFQPPAAAQVRGTFRTVSRADAVERIYAFHRIPRYGVLVIYGISVASALAGWRATMAVYAVLFGAAALALTALVLLTRENARRAEAGRRAAELEAEVRERNRVAAEVRALNATLEERVRRRTAELQAANTELEAFAYSVSHDLRAPLRAIDGFSRAVEEDYGPTLDEAGRDALRRVRAGAQRMAQLIDDLLKLSRLSRAQMSVEPVDLAALARTVTDELRAAEPGREVELVIPPALAARGDRALLAVVLENLLGNAWKFTGKKARARIEVGATTAGGGETAYFVRDDGAGFDMAHAANIFAPFQRLHRQDEFPGTGIGLATVRRIVQRHGGRTWAEGEPGKGATFYFTLGT